jgi:hypothetical protein
MHISHRWQTTDHSMWARGAGLAQWEMTECVHHINALKRYNFDLASFEILKYNTMISTGKARKDQQQLNERTIGVFFLKKRVDLIFRSALIGSS